VNGDRPGRAGDAYSDDTLVHATVPMAACGPLDPAVRRVLDYLTGEVMDLEAAGLARMIDQASALRALGLAVPWWSAVGRITGQAAAALRTPPRIRPGRPPAPRGGQVAYRPAMYQAARW
jgi:hypothetical protein